MKFELVAAKKAEAAAGKKAVEDQKKAAAEAAEWKKGSKDDSKAYAASYPLGLPSKY